MTIKPPRASPLARHAVAGLALALSLAFGVTTRGEDFVLERFGDYVESLRDQFKIPGLAATVVGTNDVLWERAFGRQDVDRFIAARTDTPFHTDGLTQIFSAAMVLRCAEEGQLSLDDPAGKFKPDTPEPGATLRQLLTHTSEGAGGLVFSYRPDRLDPLWQAVKVCRNGSFRKTLANVFDQFGMGDSVPGPDAPQLVPPAEGIPSKEVAARYTQTLSRLATPYAVDIQGHAVQSRYTATTLTPATGLISTVRDFARFDLALRGGVILRASTLAEAWQPPIGASKQRLPHGLGWFVQSYNGVPVVWQFGVGESGSSSLVVTLPAQKMTLILLANSNGLVKSSPLPLSSGDLTVSPFGRAFLNVFAR